MGESALRQFGWVYLELMGHRTRIGRAQEEEIAGGMMRHDDFKLRAEGAVIGFCAGCPTGVFVILALSIILDGRGI